MRHSLRPVVLLLLLGAAALPAEERQVHRLRLEGPIGPMTADVVDRAVTGAELGNAVCLVIEMDTPGGLDTAMRRIVKRILSADVPVVVYVSPGGSRAASAGAFIAIAGHVAAMAPGTNIGAAHPVQIGGAIADSTTSEKATNDAAAYIRALAKKRGRNPDWAEEAVRESASITAEEALAKDVIDLVVAGLPALLDSLDGRHVEVLSGDRRLETRGAVIIDIEMGLRERVLSRLSDPNIAYILMVLGVYGLMFELYNPGSIFPGVVGAVCLILALYALQTLPVNYAGLLLIVLGIVLFILEVKITSYGALTMGGIVCMTLGSTMLFDTPGALIRISWTVITPAVLATALFFAFAIGMGIRAQRAAPCGGLDDLVGKKGIARTDIGSDGTVFVAGEYWQARCDGHIPSGEGVEVIGVSGSAVDVRPV